MISTWQATLPDGTTSEELLLAFDQGRERRVLILPAWFDEANKMRRFTVQAMRALDEAGVDAFLPDLPGCIAHGRTEPEAVENAQTAIELYLEDLSESGGSIPEPRQYHLLPA